MMSSALCLRPVSSSSFIRTGSLSTSGYCFLLIFVFLLVDCGCEALCDPHLEKCYKDKCDLHVKNSKC